MCGFFFLHLCMCVYFVASQFVLPVSLCPLGSPVSPSPGHPSLFEVAISPESKPAIKPILVLCPFRIFTNGLLWAPRNKNNQNESGPSCAIILCLLLGPPVNAIYNSCTHTDGSGVRSRGLLLTVLSLLINSCQPGRGLYYRTVAMPGPRKHCSIIIRTSKTLHPFQMLSGSLSLFEMTCPSLSSLLFLLI